MLSRGARAVHRLTAVGYGAFGATLFLAPSWAADRFPWTISPFVAMTIGGWCLGVTAFTWIGGRRGPVGALVPVLAFAWLFGLSEIAVLYLDKPAFDVSAPLAIPYVAALALTLASAGFGLLEIAHRRSSARGSADGSDRARPVTTAILVAAALGLGALGVVSGVSGIVSPATSGKVFPEAVTLFTVRAFAALSLSLALGAAVAAVGRSRVAAAWLAVGTIFLLGPTLIAAIVNLDAFDLVNRPLGWLYLGAIGLGLVLAVGHAWFERVVLRSATPMQAGIAPAPGA
ncbi:MAG TPA: hypothetical protein VKR30_09480 [Candidatus Limnocylindrales bacterium]|nr:hypothetical protein [Candidatus Limnocylindrales bacterium]